MRWTRRRRLHARQCRERPSDVLRALLLALSTRRRVGDLMDRVPATRRLVRRFVAGTTADSALDVVARVNALGMAGAGAYLGENGVRVGQARAGVLACAGDGE